MNLSAKFQVVSQTISGNATLITLSPDMGDTASQLWSVGAPNASITLTVTNPAAIAELSVGKVVTVTFAA